MIDHLGKDYEASILQVVKDANARGEFFTPFELSRLMAELVGEVASVHDPACGSGSLLLTVNAQRKHGQEVNPTTAEMARKNLPDAEIITGNTLYLDAPKRCEAVVSNPPYSVPYDLSQIDPFDLRYQGKPLAPKTKSDLMFVLHGIEVMERIGVYVMFPGVLYRSGAEAKIRAYLLGQNLIDSVIQLPEKLFLRTSIATCLLILRKDRKAGAPILFVDASDEFKADDKINVLRSDRILEAVTDRKEIDRFSALVVPDDDVLTVSHYLDSSPPAPSINPVALRLEMLDKAHKKEVASEMFMYLVDWMEAGMPPEKRPKFLPANISDESRAASAFIQNNFIKHRQHDLLPSDEMRAHPLVYDLPSI